MNNGKTLLKMRYLKGNKSFQIMKSHRKMYTEKKKESLVTKPSLLKESLIIPE